MKRNLLVLGVLVLARAAFAGEADFKAAAVKALPLLEKGARGSMEQRQQCFTCHNQGLPILAMATAKARGLEIDQDHLDKQLQHIAGFLAKNKEKFLQGRGTGGQVDTAGYALWTLENGGWKPDATTAAVAEYLLLYQKELDSWRSGARRPPTEQSPFTTTYLALRGLKAYGTPEQRDRIEQRFNLVRKWLVKTPPQDTEDRVFRLWALKIAGAADEEVRLAAQDLLSTQHKEGGWAQTGTMEPDAYATGTALVALHQAGYLATADPAYQKGLKFLLGTQQADGSWFVRSRSKPFQIYFESGFPHGKDQFISIAASGWATTALTLALPK